MSEVKPREFWINEALDSWGYGASKYSHHTHVIEYWAYEKLQAENEFLKEYFMDALIQGCGTYHPNTKEYSFDHMCLSTYEHMVAYALKNGWITKEQVTR